MTNAMSPRDPDAILAAWLDEGPAKLPETTRRAIAVTTRTTRQRRHALGVPRRPNVMNPFARLAVAATAIVIVAGGATYLLSPGNQGLGGPTPTPVSSSSFQPSADPSADPSTTPTASPSLITEGGSGNAHYEITGPDAASGDATFVSSTFDRSSDTFSQSVVFQDGSLVIKITFAPAGCNDLGLGPCGAVDITTATGSLRDSGWRGTPLPARPSCTWDTPSLADNGGTGTVDCINAVNPAHPDTPNRVLIMFTYQDPGG